MPLTAEPRALPDGAGELVIENGPQNGFRRALVGPLTFIGRAEWCDLRVDAAAVNPWHCVVARSESGLVLRDLHSDAGTLVNGQLVSSCSLPLRDGDLLAVGPVQLRVRWAPADKSARADLEREREKLRAEAASLAARQAELERQEQERRAAAEKVRQELLRLSEEVRLEREALVLDRNRYEDRVAQVQQELASDRLAMAEKQKELRTQVERLVQTRLRVRRRWEQQVAAEKDRLQARETALAQGERALEEARAEHYRQRLRFNGEAELGRRELQAARASLRQEQELQAARFSQREWSAREREGAVFAREQALAKAEREAARRARQLQRDCAQRQQELDGLENRVRNCRQRLLDLEREAAGRQARAALATTPARLLTLADAPPRPVQPEIVADLEALEALAGELADQRLCLAEQCERFGRARQQWQHEREAVAAELEEAARDLAERARALREQEQALQALEEEIKNRWAAAERARHQAEADRARLLVQTVAPGAESDRAQRRVQELQEQVEHLACLLMEEPTIPFRRLGQAA